MGAFGSSQSFWDSTNDEKAEIKPENERKIILSIVNFNAVVWCEVWKREMFGNRQKTLYSRCTIRCPKNLVFYLRSQIISVMFSTQQQQQQPLFTLFW